MDNSFQACCETSCPSGRSPTITLPLRATEKLMASSILEIESGMIFVDCHDGTFPIDTIVIDVGNVIFCKSAKRSRLMTAKILCEIIGWHCDAIVDVDAALLIVKIYSKTETRGQKCVSFSLDMYSALTRRWDSVASSESPIVHRKSNYHDDNTQRSTHVDGQRMRQ